MNTPIADFVKKYIDSDTTRFHMPGHKGHVFFGWEPYDITEIEGADVLYHGNGIIAESEKNATELFGSGLTHYSTCGSTSCIKAMLAILVMEQKKEKKPSERPYILAARNVHRSMIDACALLDLDVEFIKTQDSQSRCSSVVQASDLQKTLEEKETLPLGVYVTSPDYMGQITDIAGLSAVCRMFALPLLVDNAHGAYLHFLENAKHPMDLGAAMCCDSAHKTLPALTGAAYLHIHTDYCERFAPYAAQALSLFCTTSPSYLIMQSLDFCNAYMASDYRKDLKELVALTETYRQELRNRGIAVWDSEPLKIVIDTAKNGYTGDEIAEEMRKFQIECEYADGQNVVLMVTVENSKKDWERLKQWGKSTMLVQCPKSALPYPSVSVRENSRKLTIREAVFAPAETIPVTEAAGRICASQTVACPPAIPIAISGEIISSEMIEEFQKFGIQEVSVVKEEPL